MRLHPHEIAIGILEDAFDYEEGEEPFPDPRSAFDGKADALRFLRDLTGQDLGEDAGRWRKWFRRCSRETLDSCYERYGRTADRLDAPAPAADNPPMQRIARDRVLQWR